MRTCVRDKETSNVDRPQVVRRRRERWEELGRWQKSMNSMLSMNNSKAFNQNIVINVILVRRPVQWVGVGKREQWIKSEILNTWMGMKEDKREYWRLHRNSLWMWSKIRVSHNMHVGLLYYMTIFRKQNKQFQLPDVWFHCGIEICQPHSVRKSKIPHKKKTCTHRMGETQHMWIVFTMRLCSWYTTDYSARYYTHYTVVDERAIQRYSSPHATTWTEHAVTDSFPLAYQIRTRFSDTIPDPSLSSLVLSLEHFSDEIELFFEKCSQRRQHRNIELTSIHESLYINFKYIVIIISWRSHKH